MSLLSTFAILFETDAKKATKETEELSDALDDVEGAAEGATGGVDDTTKAYNSNSASAGLLTKSMVGLVAGFVTLEAIMSKVLDTATSIDTIGKLSQTMGENIVMMDAWGAANERNGGSAEALRGTVESLQNSLQDISITGGGEIINTLAMIGVQATKANGEIKGAFEILPKIGEAFKKMSTQQSFAFGKRLGLDQGTILTLQQSRHEIDKLVQRQKELGGVTKEGYENAARFNDQWSDTKRVFNSLWMSANNSILPLFENILKGLENIGLWIQKNKSFIADALTGAGIVLATVFAPFTAIGIALIALTDDLVTWVSGGKSAVGEMLGTFENFKVKVTEIFNSLGKVWDDFIGKLTNIPKVISDVLFSNGSKNTFGLEVTTLNDDDVPSSTVRNPYLTLNNDDVPSSTDMAQEIIASYSATNLNHGGSTVNQRTQQNNVTIGGATVDARGMSGSQAKSAINASMKESVEMALGQLNDGVER